MHFSIDVVSHSLQGRHPDGQDAQLYFCLHSSFALGQITLGAFALITVTRAPRIMTGPLFLVSAGAGAGWLLVAWLYIEYPQPRFVIGAFLVLLFASWAFRTDRD